jgi:flagellar hook assembly protein FlgD
VTRLGNAVVTDYALSQNYPNPFNPTTTIEFALPTNSKVDVDIYNILGQKVASLFSGYKSVGYHQVEWNASNFGSGVYFYKINATSERGDKFQAVKKLIISETSE